MRNIIFIAIVFSLLGCGNLSPRQDQKIDNQNGRIDDIKNNQNGIMAEIGNLKNQSDIQNSKLDKVQQGLMNVQSTNENHGIQILSGSGGLIVGIVAIVSLTLLSLHYRSQSKKNENTANLLAQRLFGNDNFGEHEEIFKIASAINLDEPILNLYKKHHN